MDVAQLAQCPAVTGVGFMWRNGRNMKQTSYCLNVLGFRLRGFLPPCRHMSLYRGALLCADIVRTSRVAN